MAHPRRPFWLLLPTLVGGAFLLPTSDEFTAVRSGRQVDIVALVELESRTFLPSPRLYREERAYAFGEDADIVERTIRKDLDRAKGWRSFKLIDFHPSPVLAKRAALRDMRSYVHITSRDKLITIRYRKPVDGVRLVVLVQESRDPWNHLQRRMERMVGR